MMIRAPMDDANEMEPSPTAPTHRQWLVFLTKMTAIQYVFPMITICAGIYFHWKPNLGSNHRPSIQAFALGFGGFGFWIPAAMYAFVPTLAYFLVFYLVASLIKTPLGWARFDKLLHGSHGVFPVFSFTFLQPFVT